MIVPLGSKIERKGRPFYRKKNIVFSPTRLLSFLRERTARKPNWEIVRAPKFGSVFRRRKSIKLSNLKSPSPRGGRSLLSQPEKEDSSRAFATFARRYFVGSQKERRRGSRESFRILARPCEICVLENHQLVNDRERKKPSNLTQET